ncbi:sel1 repeat family protein [Pelomyxa schiedti]|nr:sel1 repeat family protein [Pelomyxa schiedti]
MAATMTAVDDFVIETVRMCANGNFKEAIPRCNEMLLTEVPITTNTNTHQPDESTHVCVRWVEKWNTRMKDKRNPCVSLGWLGGEPVVMTAVTETIAWFLLRWAVFVATKEFSAMKPFAVDPLDEFLDRGMAGTQAQELFFRRIAHRAAESQEASLSSAGNYLLGEIHFFGVGVDQDTTLAAEYFRKGVSQGSVLSMRNLALCYLEGNGVPKNEIEAFRLFKMGASMNSAPCQTEVATCLETGKGVEQDITEAVRMYSVAAQQVFPDAMAQLGYFLTVGTGGTGGGTAPNPKEGVAALRAAADWGNSAGQVMYGRVLERGYGFCDIKEALKWYMLAHANNTDSALDYIAIICSPVVRRMTD